MESLKSTTSTPPRLQPPGAGLPFAQRLYLRFWLGPVVSRRASRAECRKAYEARTQRIIDLAASVPAPLRGEKFLVRPIPGLEDSSRYWSVHDTLEHLLTVSRSMEQLILSLSSGKVPSGKADIAKTKPKGASGDLYSEFSQYAPGLMQRLDERLNQPGMNPDSDLAFEHPWFGAINAHQWYWLLSVHQGIHLRQMREITQKAGSFS